MGQAVTVVNYFQEKAILNVAHHAKMAAVVYVISTISHGIVHLQNVMGMANNNLNMWKSIRVII